MEAKRLPIVARACTGIVAARDIAPATKRDYVKSGVWFARLISTPHAKRKAIKTSGRDANPMLLVRRRAAGVARGEKG